MRMVWLMAVVLSSVSCSMADARTIGGEPEFGGGMVADQSEAAPQARPAAMKSSSPMALVVAVPEGAPATDTFTATAYEGQVDDAGRRSPKRHAAKFIHTTAFETPMPEPVALLLLGTVLFGAAGLCVYRAARVKRNTVALAVSCSG